MIKIVLFVAVLAGVCGAPQAACGATVPSDERTFAEVFPMKPAPVETDYVTLSNACGMAKASLVGAHVVSYRPAGGEEVLFCPTSMPFASGMKLHGGVPICWPWFANGGTPASQAHGFARYARFAVVSHEQGKDVSVLKLQLESSDETKQWFPHDFRLTLVVTLGRRLNLELVTENVGTTAFEVTEGFHTYLAVGDSSKTVVKGLSGSRLDLMDPAKENPSFTGDWTLTHFGSDVFIPNAHEWLVQDGARLIGVAARGTKQLILYNPGPPKPWNQDNLALDDYRRFLCVEPVTIERENAVRILPGKTHSIQMSLGVAPVVRRPSDAHERKEQSLKEL